MNIARIKGIVKLDQGRRQVASESCQAGKRRHPQPPGQNKSGPPQDQVTAGGGIPFVGARRLLRPILRHRMNRVKAVFADSSCSELAKVLEFPQDFMHSGLSAPLARLLPNGGSNAWVFLRRPDLRPTALRRPAGGGAGPCFGMYPGKRLRLSGRPSQTSSPIVTGDRQPGECRPRPFAIRVRTVVPCFPMR